MQFKFKCRFLNEEQQELLKIIPEVQQADDCGCLETARLARQRWSTQGQLACSGAALVWECRFQLQWSELSNGCVSTPHELIYDMYSFSQGAEFQSSPWFAHYMSGKKNALGSSCQELLFVKHGASDNGDQENGPSVLHNC